MSAHTPQILVADDDPEIRKLLGRYIEAQAFRVLLASSCGELRERIATNRIDLIVLDVLLPDGSGLNACRDLRAERNTIPIILLTAKVQYEDVLGGYKLGADYYITKPFTSTQLINGINLLLGEGKS